MPAPTTDNKPTPPAISGWPFELRTTTVDGTEISYTDEGSGSTLLLVHDGMCSYIWVHLIDRLRDRFRIVTLDFPGSGLSPATVKRVSLESDSRILETFVDQLDLGAYTPVVHDLGGGVGIGMATRRPEPVEGLVLINTFAWPAETAGLRGMLRVMGSRPMRSMNSATNFMARASSTRFGVGRRFDRAQRHGYVGMFQDKGPRRRFHDLMASAVSENDYLATVETGLSRLSDRPALTIFGQRNDPFGFQDRWLDHFPNAQQMVVPKGYHFPMCDQPDAVAARITEWHTAKVTGSSSISSN